MRSLIYKHIALILTKWGVFKPQTLTLGAIGLVLLLMGISFVQSNLDIPFERDKWDRFYDSPGLLQRVIFHRRYREIDWSVRLRMVKDVIARIQGQSARAVVALLGKDDFYGQNRVWASKQVAPAADRCQMRYILWPHGRNRGGRTFRTPYLCIEVINGEVRSSQVVEN